MPKTLDHICEAEKLHNKAKGYCFAN